MDPDSAPRLRDVSDWWFDQRDAAGYLTVCVLTEGNAERIVPVTLHHSRAYDPEPDPDRSNFPGLAQASRPMTTLPWTSVRRYWRP